MSGETVAEQFIKRLTTLADHLEEVENLEQGITDKDAHETADELEKLTSLLKGKDNG